MSLAWYERYAVRKEARVRALDATVVRCLSCGSWQWEPRLADTGCTYCTRQALP